MGIQRDGFWYDDMVDALLVLDHTHHETHTGNHWYTGYADNALAVSDYLDVLFVTNNDLTLDYLHMIFLVEADGKATAELYENPIVTSLGTPTKLVNRFRAKQNERTPYLTGYYNPVIEDVGEELNRSFLGSEGFKETSGGSNRDTNELILDINTTYLVRVINDSSDTIRVKVAGDWYRHDSAYHNTINANKVIPATGYRR